MLLTLFFTLVVLFVFVRLHNEILALQKKIANLEMRFQHPTVDVSQDQITDTETSVSAPCETLETEGVTAVEPQFKNILLSSNDTSDIIDEKTPAADTTLCEEDSKQLVAPDALSIFISRTIEWMIGNWVLSVAGISLSLAAIFLVQYGIESGAIGPKMRVFFAVVLGGAFIGGAEYLGKKEIDFAKKISTVLVASGVISLFAAVYTAHALYGLIGPGMGFALLSLIAFIGTFGGWRYGPFLSILSLMGGLCVPFMVSSQTVVSPLLYVYPLVLVAMAMLIDSLRGWIWVSVLGLVGGFASIFIYQHTGLEPAVAVFAFSGMAFLAPYCLYLSLSPKPFGYVNILEVLEKRGDKNLFSQIDCRILIVMSTVAVSMVGILFSVFHYGDTVAPALISIALLLCVYGILLYKSEAFSENVWIAALGFGFVLLLDPVGYVRPENIARRLSDFPFIMIVLATSAITALLAWRSVRSDRALPWSIVTALPSAIVVLALHVNWGSYGNAPYNALTDWGWSLHVMVLAGVMTFTSVFFAKYPQMGSRCAAYPALSAVGLLTYALFVMASGSSVMVIGLFVMVGFAAWLDRQFDLKPMGAFILSAIVLAYIELLQMDLIADDLGGILNNTFVMLVMLGALLSAYVFLQYRKRIYVGEVVLASFILNLVIGLVITNLTFVPYFLPRSFAEDSLVGMFVILPVLLGFFLQKHLLNIAGSILWIRLSLAVFLGGVACVLMSVNFAIYLLDTEFYITDFAITSFLGFEITPILNSATLQCFSIIAALYIGVKRVPMHRIAYWCCITIAALHAILWTMIQTRLIFGNHKSISDAAFYQSELYTYTILMLIISAIVLYQSVAKQSVMLRRVGLGLLALTIAKVFLFDVTALSDLLRVFAFLVLGLSLVALAWLDGWIADKSIGGGKQNSVDSTE